MENPKRYLYLKFRIGDDMPVPDAFLVSENKERADNWIGDRQTAETPAETPQSDRKAPFDLISSEFENSIAEFQTAVPFIMQMVPFLLRLQIDVSLRRFAKRNGELTQSDAKLETYRLNVDRLNEVTKRVDRNNTISKGVDSLPAMFLVGLVSAYDVFLASLIKTIYTVKPDLLSSSERNISLKDLVEIGSVDAARDRIVEKEVETVIRQNHADQIKWLSSKLSLPLTSELKIWPDFIELCERRNLFTHVGGVVSAQYIEVCKSHGADVSRIVAGQKLAITPEYYANAVSTILEFGIKLVQVIWRKLRPDEIDAADKELNEFSYRLIADGRYQTASTMLHFGLHEMKRHGTDATRKMMVVNHANAEKMLGNKDRAYQILDSEDWTASTDNYRICVAAVRDDTETVIKMMKSVVDSGQIRKESFREWPVFEAVRKDPRFVEAFEREFGEKFILDAETRNVERRQGESESESTEDPGGETIH